MDMATVIPQGKAMLESLALNVRTSITSLKTYFAIPCSLKLACCENVWLLCWILKDLGWALYCGMLAWPAAVVAIWLQAQDVQQRWATAPVGEWVHSLATLAWLCGSSVWMTVALLFEPEIHTSRTSPWYSGALFTASPFHYQRGVAFANIIEVAACIGLLLFYAVSLKSHPSFKSGALDPTVDALVQRKEARRDAAAAAAAAAAVNSVDTQGLVFGILTPEVYSKVFIAPWLLKDVFWSQRMFIPSIICMLLVTVLMADYLFLFMQWKNLAVLLWTTGTAVWIAHDLVMHDQEIWPLLLSVVLFAVAGCILAVQIGGRPKSYRSKEFKGGDSAYTSSAQEVYKSETEPLSPF